MLTQLDLQALPDVARVHCQAFPASAITWMGLEAARRYYEWLLTGPHDSLALGYFDEGVLCGYAFGGVFRGALTGYLRKNRGFLACRILLRPWLLALPEFRSRLALGTRLAAPRRQPTAPPADEPPSFGILAIATHPTHTGKGVGRQLMREMEREALRRGFSRMSLSVHPSNATAIGFYTGLDWQKVNKDGLWSGLMERILT